MSRDWKKFFANKNNYVVILLVGVLLLVMLLPVGESGMYSYSENEDEKQRTQTMSNSFGETLDTTQSYCKMLEEKMEQLLSRIEGVGETKVLITMRYSEEKFMEEETLVKTQVPRVQGVMVVAKGAGSGDVDLKISQIVQALLGVEAHKIAIAKMEAR